MGVAMTRRTLGVIVLSLTTVFTPLVQGRQPSSGRSFGRTELFFGTATPTSLVTEAQFQAFVDQHVTTRFPDGLTVLRASGQFLGDDHIVTKEPSFVLIVLYPYEARHESRRKLDEIRAIYKDLYQQQSVLRVDDSAAVWVRF
jgi:hypothetical protein